MGFDFHQVNLCANMSRACGEFSYNTFHSDRGYVLPFDEENVFRRSERLSTAQLLITTRKSCKRGWLNYQGVLLCSR